MDNLHARCALALAASTALAACSGATVVPSQHATTPFTSAKSKPATAYLYVENANNTISAFSVASDGALTALGGSPFATNTVGPSPFGIAFDPRGSFLYATGSQSQSVEVFSVASDGSLVAESSSDAAGDGANAAVLSKSDGRLYVANSVATGSLAAFDVSKKTGALRALSGSPYPIGCGGFCQPFPSDAVIGGSFLYAIDSGGWYVSTFTIAKNGALSEVASYPTHEGPIAGVLTPNGQYLYVTNGASGDISAYSVAGTALTPLSGSPFAAGNTPEGIAVTSDGTKLYVANRGDSTLSGYAIGAGGALTPLPGSPYADGSGGSPTALALDKKNNYLFVANSSADTLAVYKVGTAGSLTPVRGSPFGDGAGAGGPEGLAVDTL
jgi:6-phosphogluconolactonase